MHTRKIYDTADSEQSGFLAEAVASYGTRAIHAMSGVGVSAHERATLSTMSVDEYFDELIALVHQDYEALPQR